MVKVQRLIQGVLKTNTYIIKNEKHVLIVDPTGDAQKIKTKISNDYIVDAILLTHGHFDHIGAVDMLADFYNCPVYLNSNDVFLAQSKDINSFGHWNACICTKTIPYLETKMRIGEFDVDVWFMKGHTAGSTVFAIDEHLFTGDVLFKGAIGRTDLFSGDATEMKHSLSMLKTMDEGFIVYPGHDETTTMKYELQNNRYLR